MTDELTNVEATFTGASRIYPERHFTVAQPEMTLGDVDLETFYRRHKAELVWHVKATTNISYEEAEDAIQEAFVRALKQGKPISNPHGWFKIVTIQIVADSHPKSTAHRKQRYVKRSPRLLRCPNSRGTATNGPFLRNGRNQRRAAVGRGRDRTLSGKPRMVMAEHYSGTPHKEIARLLGISTAAVRQNLARARRALRKRAETRQKDSS